MYQNSVKDKRDELRRVRGGHLTVTIVREWLRESSEGRHVEEAVRKLLTSNGDFLYPSSGGR